MAADGAASGGGGGVTGAFLAQPCARMQSRSAASAQRRERDAEFAAMRADTGT